MAEILKNVIEDIARDFLNTTLTMRYDICTCNQCKNEMLAYVLSRVPAKYATTEQGVLYTIIEQTRVEHAVEITKEILNAINIIGKNPRHQVRENKEQTFQLLLDKILQDRGLDFRHYRQELLKRRVALRIRANNLDSYSDYLRFLMKNHDEYDKLFETLYINVSEFFRDPDVWIAIRNLFETVIRQKTNENDKPLKIWSAACANGEEPYSIAILLKEILKSGTTNFSFEIQATDIDKKCLKIAETAEYKKTILKNVDNKYLNDYFTPNEGNYRLKDEIKNMVKFQRRDLILEPYLENTDIIICRNVFIYFSRSLQEQLLTKFHKSLKTGGYLVLGKSEVILHEARTIFEEINADARMYRKK
ncbi:MAG: CheR family methyltransferase [Candidatus Omnitrophota bacterium]